MTDMDGSEIRRVDEIIANLPEKDRELMERHREMASESLRRSAAVAIMARNFSHNLGQHCHSAS